MVGNGNDNTSRSNAMTILKNGRTGIGTSSPAGRLHAILVVQVFLTGGGPLNTASVQTNIDPGEQHTFVTGTKIITLNPGTYTIDTPIRNDNLSGPTLTVTSGKLSVIVIQE